MPTGVTSVSLLAMDQNIVGSCTTKRLLFIQNCPVSAVMNRIGTQRKLHRTAMGKVGLECGSKGGGRWPQVWEAAGPGEEMGFGGRS